MLELEPKIVKNLDMSNLENTENTKMSESSESESMVSSENLKIYF